MNVLHDCNSSSIHCASIGLSAGSRFAYQYTNVTSFYSVLSFTFNERVVSGWSASFGAVNIIFFIQNLNFQLHVVEFELLIGTENNKREQNWFMKKNYLCFSLFRKLFLHIILL